MSDHDDQMTYPGVTADQIRDAIYVALSAIISDDGISPLDLADSKAVLLKAAQNKNWVVYVP